MICVNDWGYSVRSICRVLVMNILQIRPYSTVCCLYLEGYWISNRCKFWYARERERGGGGGGSSSVTTVVVYRCLCSQMEVVV